MTELSQSHFQDSPVKIQNYEPGGKTDCLAGNWGKISTCKGTAVHEAVCDDLFFLRCCDNPDCIRWAVGDVFVRRNNNAMPTLRGAIQGQVEV
ncbi:hypothetical protein HQ571_02470 [Candidatus Kuenenbacteria bacterium]|nr:hypothetical protein [Candidatus Kuenenbacteria bacterium]